MNVKIYLKRLKFTENSQTNIAIWFTYFWKVGIMKNMSKGEDGKVIWICDILTHIQPYYVRVFTPSYAK